MHRARVLALLLMLAGTAVSASAQGESGPRYLALGDSVTFGFIAQAGFEYVNANNFIVLETQGGDFDFRGRIRVRTGVPSYAVFVG